MFGCSEIWADAGEEVRKLEHAEEAVHKKDKPEL